MSFSVVVNPGSPKRQLRTPEWEESEILGVLRHIKHGNLIARVRRQWVSVSSQRDKESLLP